MRLIFLTFGGPTKNYHDAVNRICREAKYFNIFDKIVGLTEVDLKKDLYFWNKHSQFLEKNKTGYGYWLWKSYIVKKQLELMNDNDILVYADAGCQLNFNGINRLKEYFEIVNNSNYGILSFELSHLECAWTKMDIFKYFNALNLLETNQLVGGIFILRKCNHTIYLVNKWYDACCIYNLIDDSKSKEQNHSSFKCNRRDQSLWSIIRKQNGSEIIKDETFFNWENNEWNNFPILAKRLRRG